MGRSSPYVKVAWPSSSSPFVDDRRVVPRKEEGEIGTGGDESPGPLRLHRLLTAGAAHLVRKREIEGPALLAFSLC